MMSFDEWMDKNHGGLFDIPHQRECFEAGAQSRQAEVYKLQTEIDELQEEVNQEREEATEYFTDLEYANAKCRELQKRIDDLKNWCVSGVECNMLSTEYNQALIDMFKILKGNQNETRFD